MQNRALSDDQKKILKKIATAIRTLSMDAVQKANSGHPGLPLGCAEIGAYLYGHLLAHYPKNPQWANRDRLVLSAGHGSIWLYSCLHLACFALSLEEIKNFRQLHSKTPGHPEKGLTPGVEATTGPLGQGIGNAVGMALGLKILKAKFNTKEHKIFTNKVYCLCSDGDMMEGISHEAAALAGHLKLPNLVVIYDANQICLDGPLSECCSEDTQKRFEAYGWKVLVVDGHDFDELHDAFSQIEQEQKKPVLIITHTTIAKGAPNKAGSHKAHGAPLGEEEVAYAKANMHIPEEPFYISHAVQEYFSEKLVEQKEKEQLWQEEFRLWAKHNPQLSEEFEKMQAKSLPLHLEELLKRVEMGSSLAGRKASSILLQKLAELFPDLIGGSADLSGSDLTLLENYPLIGPGHFSGRNIKFGVREFGMGTIANGLALTDFFTPFIGTFLTFSDYLRNSIRVACLSKIRVIYQFTHDSIFLGEDGPTHQPIEHYAALRAIPHLQVIRPADANEVRGSWIAALNAAYPTAILLSRQNLPTLKETDVPFQEGVGRGGYIVRREKNRPDYTLFATGSELKLALDVAFEIEKIGKEVRVVSMPCFALFEKQEESYRNLVVGGDLGMRVSIEAGVEQGWYKYIGREGIAICLEDYGASAPKKALEEEFGFQVDSILERILH